MPRDHIPRPDAGENGKPFSLGVFASENSTPSFRGVLGKAQNSEAIPLAELPRFLNLKDYVTQKTSGQTPAWTFIPQTELTELGARYTAWHEAYLPTVPPHAKPQTDAKNDERKRAEDFVRPFINRYLRYPHIGGAGCDVFDASLIARFKVHGR